MSVPSAESAISMPSKMVSAAEVSPFLFKLALILMKPQVTLANWREAPYNRWAFHNVRELIPSAEIAHDPARVRTLERRPRDLEVRIAGARAAPPGGAHRAGRRRAAVARAVPRRDADRRLRRAPSWRASTSIT